MTRRLPVPVVVTAAVFAIVYLALDFNKLYALRYGADTGTFLQFLVNEAHGHGSWNNAEYRPHLQVHDSWMLLALVPLIAAFPYAQTLIIVEVFAVAAGGVALYYTARAFGAGERESNIVAIAYLISATAQGLAYNNFLENIFVPLLAFLGAIAARRHALIPALIVAQLLLGLKEDEAAFLLWFGAACAIWWDRRMGIAVVALAAVNGAGYALYEALNHVHPSHPAYALHVDDPFAKLQFFIAVLAPFAFAPLWTKWRMLLAAPLVAEITLNKPWAYQITRLGMHWTAPFVAVCAIAAAYVLAKRPRFATPMLVLSIAMALLFNDTVMKIGRWPYIVDWRAYANAAALRADGAGAATVPRAQEGVYAIAAANPRVRLARYRKGETGYCPSFNTEGRAFLASLGLGSWPRGVRLCEGVAVRP